MSSSLLSLTNHNNSDWASNIVHWGHQPPMVFFRNNLARPPFSSSDWIGISTQVLNERNYSLIQSSLNSDLYHEYNKTQILSLAVGYLQTQQILDWILTIFKQVKKDLNSKKFFLLIPTYFLLL